MTAQTKQKGEIDAGALEKHVLQLASAIGERNVFRPAALTAAAHYIEKTWSDQGYAVSKHVYETHGQQCANLEVTRRGDRYPEKFLLIGAHYDSVRGAPGANDNASGVAALLEISRLFQQQHPAISVRFVAFVNEEPPFFMRSNQGSMVYAKMVKNRGDDIALMVSMDCIGCYSEQPGYQRYPPFFGFFYPSQANYLAVVSNLTSRESMHLFVEQFRAASDFPLEHLATTSFIPGVSWSDHRSFWKQGYQALLVTDTAFYRYRHYHRASDTPDKISYPMFTRAVVGLHRTFTQIAALDWPA
ncbi:MAG: M28 family peptidase [Hyphomicrobiales bacterium]|nr:M28 family peptidase [Hyphomicrobiales bacterium]